MFRLSALKYEYMVEYITNVVIHVKLCLVHLHRKKLASILVMCHLALLHFPRRNMSIFELQDDGQPGFQLKGEIQFHLYISTSPCGDARIFSPHEVSTSEGTTTKRVPSWQNNIPYNAIS